LSRLRRSYNDAMRRLLLLRDVAIGGFVGALQARPFRDRAATTGVLSRLRCSYKGTVCRSSIFRGVSFVAFVGALQARTIGDLETCRGCAACTLFRCSYAA
jgi:hypothetical protein